MLSGIKYPHISPFVPYMSTSIFLKPVNMLLDMAMNLQMWLGLQSWNERLSEETFMLQPPRPHFFISLNSCSANHYFRGCLNLQLCQRFRYKWLLMVMVPPTHLFFYASLFWNVFYQSSYNDLLEVLTPNSSVLLSFNHYFPLKGKMSTFKLFRLLYHLCSFICFFCMK